MSEPHRLVRRVACFASGVAVVDGYLPSGSVLAGDSLCVHRVPSVHGAAQPRESDAEPNLASVGEAQQLSRV